MHVELTSRQQEYVEAYRNILERLGQIQEELSTLGSESSALINKLNELREQESVEFPGDNDLIQNLKNADN